MDSNECMRVSKEIFRKATNSLWKHRELCMQKDGAHFEQQCNINENWCALISSNQNWVFLFMM